MDTSRRLPRLDVINGRRRDVGFEHFFQAHGLSGHLYVVIVPLLALAMFIFYGEYRAVRVKFYDIATSADSEHIRPDRQSKFHPDAFFDVMGQLVDAFVFAGAAFGVDVVGKFTFRMDQVATPWAVGVLVEGG